MTIATVFQTPFVVAFIFVSLIPAIVNSQGETEYGYDALNGPSKWGSLSAENSLCDEGKQQSPVNFDARDLKLNVFPSDFELASMTRFNVTRKKYAVSLVPTDDALGARGMTVDGKRFSLAEFHIHTPSEHRIDNVYYPGEIHFVHNSEDGKLSVVGLFVETTTEDNPVWTRVLNNIPASSDRSVALNAIFDTADIVQATKNGVFSYNGSLTTPPCTEGVQWYVAKTPLNLSNAQILAISRLIGFSARPIMYNANVPSSSSGAPSV